MYCVWVRGLMVQSNNRADIPEAAAEWRVWCLVLLDLIIVLSNARKMKSCGTKGYISTRFLFEFLKDTTFWSQMFVRQEIHNVKQHIFVLKPEQLIKRRGAKSQNTWNHSHINNWFDNQNVTNNICQNRWNTNETRLWNLDWLLSDQPPLFGHISFVSGVWDLVPLILALV